MGADQNVEELDAAGQPLPGSPADDFDVEQHLLSTASHRLEVLRRLAPHSLEAHARLLHRDDDNRPIVAAAHHGEWIRILEDRERFPWVVVVAPPGFAKSTWFSLIYPAWRFGVTKGRVRIGIVGNAGSQASAWVSAIGDAVEQPGFYSTYPYEGTRPDKQRGWSKSSFYLGGTPKGNNPACLSSGIRGVSVLGKRFDEIVLDDPTTGDNARSKAEMDAQRDWLKKTLISRFPPGKGPPDGEGGRMTVVCTRWSESDLVPTLEELGFVVVRMPALGYPDRLVHCTECGYTGIVTGDPATDTPPHAQTQCTVPDALLEVMEYGEESLWPERISEAQLLAQMEDDPLVFELVMQGNATALAGEFFDPAWFRYAALPSRSSFEKVVQFVDTAGGKDRRKGDYFVIVTLGKIGDEFWVIDVVRERLSALRQEDAVKAAAATHDPNVIAIEDKNEGIALIQRMSVNTSLPIKPYTPVKDKEFRATPVAGKYRTGHVWHPGTIEESGIKVAKWVRRLETEMKAFPESKHDDQVDALAGAFNMLGARRPQIRVLG
jgi:predicted phage terminase large subunit-like protein